MKSCVVHAEIKKNVIIQIVIINAVCLNMDLLITVFTIINDLILWNFLKNEISWAISPMLVVSIFFNIASIIDDFPAEKFNQVSFAVTALII